MSTQQPIQGVNVVAGPSGNSFQTPYGAQKRIEGYIKGTITKRPLAFKDSFGDIDTTWSDTVNIDIEANQRNLMGQFADPEFDVYRVMLPGMGSKEWSFGYSKEAAGSPNYSEISQRLLGEQPSQVTLDSARLARLYAENMQKQMSLAYERFENLYELNRTCVLLYGKFATDGITAQGQHRKVAWDMGRDVLTNPGQQFTPYLNSPALTLAQAISSGANTPATRLANWQSLTGINGDRIPQVDLTTLAANTTTAVFGGASWDGYDAVNNAAIGVGVQMSTVSPYAHVIRMLKVANFRAGTDKIFMSNDAYSWYRYDINTNYKDAANQFYDRSEQSMFELNVAPYVAQIEGLQFREFIKFNGMSIPIYTYDGQYHDRLTGIKTAYMPQGYVLLVPPKEYGMIRYGKIMHIKARWAAQQFWVNAWVNQRTGIEQYEIHTNFLIAHTDPNSVVAWKVCSGPAPVVLN